MDEVKFDFAPLTDQQSRSALRHPSTIMLLVANLYPLAGVLLWGWDAFLLLALYWMETIIFAFWTIVWIATAEPAALGSLKMNGQPVTHPFALAMFFAAHAGLFIGVHFLFLWVLFSGDWSKRAGGVLGFFTHTITSEGFWIPLAFLFVARALILYGGPLLRWLLGDSRRALPDTPQQADRKSGSILGELYGRIVVMQVAIIFGAWISNSMGSIGPLVLLILCKTGLDLLWQRFQPMITSVNRGVQK